MYPENFEKMFVISKKKVVCYFKKMFVFLKKKMFVMELIKKTVRYFEKKCSLFLIKMLVISKSFSKFRKKCSFFRAFGGSIFRTILKVSSVTMFYCMNARIPETA